MDERDDRVWGKPSFSFGVAVVIIAIAISACGIRDLQLPEIPLLKNLELKSGLIAYLGEDGNVYTIDQAGERRKAVTADAQPTPDDAGVRRLYQFLTWSPDGRKLAFVGLDGVQGSGASVALYTASPDGDDLVEAYQSEEQYPFYLFWSPDSRRVSFLTTLPGQDIALKLVPAAGGETLTLETGAPFYWDWAPDNRTILIHTGGSAEIAPAARLAVLDIEGEIEQDLEVQPAFFQAPAWSPVEDLFLLGIETESGGQSLSLTDREGVVIRDLAEVDGPIYFDWSPDGHHLAYLANDPVSTEGLAQTLTVLEPDRPESERQAKEELVIAFFWSPDSQQIAFFTPAVVTPTPVPGQEGQAEQALFLRLHVLDTQNGESQELALFRPTEEFLNILPYFDQYARSDTIWSPDSRNLVISAHSDERDAGIYVVRADGNQEPRYITDGTLAFWSWR